MTPNYRIILKTQQWTEESACGWRDARAGMPYPKEYDDWATRDQINYEFGRLRCVLAKTVYVVVPLEQNEEAYRRVIKVYSRKEWPEPGYLEGH
jgi:hypothetical protein